MGIDQVTLGQVFSYGRDLAVAGTVISVGWKVRGGWEEVRRFIKRVTEHMDKVEIGMQTLGKLADVEVSPYKRYR